MLVVGTAGHVDHGKTALIRALTGTDTDRWEEEKRRGITIDLGFAELTVGDAHFSIVDVPGHEDFVKNMVAGATGIDVALLVVAADEGVMPQTQEHLAILNFLRVPVGIPVITKSDLVDAEWTELVVSDLTERLAQSPIDWSQPIAVSSVNGSGLGELVDKLSKASQSVEHRSSSELFRMPVDRSFTVAGTGTVVTGTVWSGTLARGASVSILPGGVESRVRAIQLHGSAAEEARPGRRTALALTGVERKQVERGSVVVSSPAWEPTSVIDVLVDLLPHARPLGQRSRVRVHLGTAEVMARVTPADQPIEPGGCGSVRLRLERPIVARWGDRGVIRSYSPVTTIAGFLVADPFPPARPRRPAALEEKAAADPQTRLDAFIHDFGEVPVAQLAVRLAVDDPSEVVGGSTGIVQAGNVLLSESEIQRRIAHAGRILDGFHDANPLLDGMPLDELRRHLGPRQVADAIIVMWEGGGTLATRGGVAARPDFKPRTSDLMERIRLDFLARLESGGLQGAGVSELQDLGDFQNIRDVAEYCVREGTAVRVGSDRYYATGILDGLVSKIVELCRDGELVPADLRSATGLTRKYLIPLLEWTDGQGITVRRGEVRILGPNGLKGSRAQPLDKG